MPLYEYLCRDCGQAFERYVRAWGDAVVCPACAGGSVEKKVSRFALAASGEGAPSSSRGGGCGCGRGGCGCHH
jgi:putative FmdB family regulatory protein